MSIIHDALKKVQQSADQKEDRKPQPVLASSPPTDANPPIFVIITAIIAIAVVILLVILWNLAKETTRTPSPAAITADQNRPVQTVYHTSVQEPATQTATPRGPSPKELGSALVSNRPVKAMEPEDPLSLIRVQGIVQKEGKLAVLINDNVYEEGQTVFGRIIARVSPDTVTFMDNGRLRTFPVKSSQKQPE
jgi:type II secretory pathway component PulC